MLVAHAGADAATAQVLKRCCCCCCWCMPLHRTPTRSSLEEAKKDLADMRAEKARQHEVKLAVDQAKKAAKHAKKAAAQAKSALKAVGVLTKKHRRNSVAH